MRRSVICALVAFASPPPTRTRPDTPHAVAYGRKIGIGHLSKRLSRFVFFPLSCFREISGDILRWMFVCWSDMDERYRTPCYGEPTSSYLNGCSYWMVFSQLRAMKTYLILTLVWRRYLEFFGSLWQDVTSPYLLFP